MIKQADVSDSRVLAELAILMWSGNTVTELESEFSKLTQDDNAACFIKYIGDKPVGFAQCGLRHDYVEGTDTSPVGYLEGIFILEDHRHKGFARELVTACEKWALEKRCAEFASDCELSNEESLRFHKAIGFEETNRIICFKKRL